MRVWFCLRVRKCLFEMWEASPWTPSDNLDDSCQASLFFYSNRCSRATVQLATLSASELSLSLCQTGLSRETLIELCSISKQVYEYFMFHKLKNFTWVSYQSWAFNIRSCLVLPKRFKLSKSFCHLLITNSYAFFCPPQWEGCTYGKFQMLVSTSVLQIRYISQTQGLPAEYLLSAGTKTTRFFNRDPDSTYPLWRLKVQHLDKQEGVWGNKSG